MVSTKIKKMGLLALAFFSMQMCTTHKQINYELPDAMLPHVKVHYADQCDKGQKLYDLSCAKCHNTKVKGKVIIPDFKPEQLTGYTLRVANSRHESSLPDTLVTEEELIMIMTFLSYKKKNK
ncbi:MAG: hypothetical protein SGJ15_10705 [Bacteroidota bacterium]|nr:hypothetical protein [Bacteroidota bacterium]